MPQTQLRGKQVLDQSIQRDDLDVTTPGNAVVRKLIAGTNVTITSTGVDAGTGDVTINASGGGSLNPDWTASLSVSLTADTDDYTNAGLAAAGVLELAATNCWWLTGITAQPNGTVKAVINSGTMPVTLKENSPSSLAANRFQFLDDCVLLPGQSCLLRYSTALGGWQGISLPSFGNNGNANHLRWKGVSTGVHAVGSNPTVGGSLSFTSVAATNSYTLRQKLEALLATAATTNIAYVRPGVVPFSVGGIAADRGGFFFNMVAGPATGVSNTSMRYQMGMRNTAGNPTDIEPSTVTNQVILGWDSADVNAQIMYRAAGAVNKVDLGANFAVPTTDRTNLYDLTMYSPPGTVQSLAYVARSLANNAVASGVLTANLPPVSNILAPMVAASVGGVSAVVGIGFDRCNVFGLA